MSTTIYGIPNCDTIKKTRRWLDAQGVDYRFHDLRSDGLERHQVEEWVEKLGWETLVNRRSTSWKELPAQAREEMDNERAVASILNAPTLIKRPLLERGKLLEVGFREQRYAELFGA